MTPLRALWLAVLALLASLALPAAAQDYPARPDGPIYDGANVISPGEEELLDRRLRDYNRATGRAIIVATVPSLDGLAVEPYAQGLAETWDIGGAESENGLLFLVAPKERRMRIHTARGLQERMTDIMSGRIIRDVVTPKFKEPDVSGGIVAGVEAIIAQLDMDPAQARAIEEAERAAMAERAENAAPAIAGVVFWIVMIVFLAIVFARRGARGRKYRGGGGVGSAVGNVLLWTAINAAMNSGRGSGGGGWGGGGGGGGSSGGGGGFGGFGGGGGGFNGGGASGGW